jgi:hypothetical protein
MKASHPVCVLVGTKSQSKCLFALIEGLNPCVTLEQVFLGGNHQLTDCKQDVYKKARFPI